MADAGIHLTNLGNGGDRSQEHQQEHHEQLEQPPSSLPGATQQQQPQHYDQQHVDDAAILASFTQTDDGGGEVAETKVEHGQFGTDLENHVQPHHDAQPHDEHPHHGQVDEEQHTHQLQQHGAVDDHAMVDVSQPPPADHAGAEQYHHQEELEIQEQHQEPQQQEQQHGEQQHIEHHPEQQPAQGYVGASAAQMHALAPASSADEANGLNGGHTFQEMDAAQSLACNALEAQRYKTPEGQPASVALDSNLDPSFAMGGSSGVADSSMQDATQGADQQAHTEPAPRAAATATTPTVETAANPPTQGNAVQPSDDGKANEGGDTTMASAPSTPSKPGLVASRKQNSACDACRSRKVRCNRDPGEDKCQHCKAKGIDCTTLYVQWATSSAKRPSKRARTSMAVSEPEAEVPKPPDSVIEAAEKVQNRLVTYFFRRDTDYPVEETKTITHAGLPYTAPSSSAGAATRQLHQTVSSSVKPAASTGPELRLLKDSTRDEFIAELIETYFSVVHVRLPLLDPDIFKRRYYDKSEELGGAPPDVLLAVVLALGAKFSQHQLIQADREESVKELERAFTSAHGALSRGEIERAHHVTGAKGGVDLPILTVPDELRRVGRNRLAEDLLIRAVEVLDRVKAHRHPTVENVQACLLAEALLYQPSTWSNDELSLVGKPVPSSHRSATLQSTAFWYSCAARHLLELGINQKETTSNIKDPAVRAELEQAWWTVCSADAESAVWTRRKPSIDEEDFDWQPAAADGDLGDTEPGAGPSSLPSRDAAAINRKFVDILRKPRHAVDGVRVELFDDISSLIEKWAANHLARVGVPLPTWPEHWDYLATVTACTADIKHHAMWILLWECIDELGIYGTDRSAVTSQIVQEHLRRLAEDPRTVADAPDAETVSLLVAKVQEQALSSAVRITSLVSELHDRSYLRLDPGMLTQSLDATARFLVRFQRPEIDTLLKCYRHLALSYEDGFEKCERIETIFRVYAERAHVDPTFEPGSSLAVALRRDVDREMASTGMDGLSIAAAAIENAAMAQRGERVEESDLKDFSALVALAHQQSQQQQEQQQQQQQQQQDEQESYVNDDQEMHHHHQDHHLQQHAQEGEVVEQPQEAQMDVQVGETHPALQLAAE